mmetsp:Transcript_106954/g.307617  ORF Transcript_106954/g.307617 Transcript_106954/m.307617 type:complete len:166 (-) Transcript_106954:121-618(-)
MPLLKPARALARPFGLGGLRRLATTPVRVHAPALAIAAAPAPSTVSRFELKQHLQASTIGAGSGALLAGSPLFLTDMNVPMYWTEIQFVLSGPINSLMESFFEVEGGPLFLNALVMATLLKMGTYYGFMQPSYLWHFQERYGQSWTVGHHLYGCDLPNPLKKEGK